MDLLHHEGLATMAVWFMTLLIQRAEHRDTQAMQAKLDELLHAPSRANNAMTRICNIRFRLGRRYGQ